MAPGVTIGSVLPKTADAIGSLSVGTTNIPIAIGLVVMMFPPLAKVHHGKLRSVFSNKRLLGLSLALNWLISPLAMFALALAFPRGTPHT